MRALARLVPLTLAGALALGGCSLLTGDDDAVDDAPVATDDAGEDVSEQTAPDDGTEEAAGIIGVDFPDPDDVIADGTFTIPGTGDEVRVGVESLTVRGDHTELRLVLTPLDGEEPVSVYDMLGNNTAGLDLIDRANLKEYRSGYTTDVVYAKAAPVESVGLQAFYSAPQDDIATIDVKVSDSWPVFEDVPLTTED